MTRLAARAIRVVVFTTMFSVIALIDLKELCHELVDRAIRRIGGR